MSHPLSNARVLLVEDSEADALLFVRQCRKMTGSVWQVDHVTGTADAQSAISTNRYDLYFCDYRLGPNTGIDLVPKIRAVNAAAPIIIITGLNDERATQRALQSGATDFLSKNALTAELIEHTAHHAFTRRSVEVAQEEQIRA